jgi:hypothetical protein
MAARLRVRLLAVPLVLVTAMTAGCGGDDGQDDAPDGEATAVPGVSAELLACLEDNGVELPEGGLPSAGPGQGESLDPGQLEQLQEAMQECSSLAPSGVPSAALDQSTLDAFSACMDDNGVAVEASLEAVTALDVTDPPVAEALETCGTLLGPASPGASPS